MALAWPAPPQGYIKEKMGGRDRGGGRVGGDGEEEGKETAKEK